MAATGSRRASDKQADGRSAGEHRLSLAEWLVLCLVREKPTYGLVLVGLLDRQGSVGRVWYVPKATVYLAVGRLELLGLIRTTGEQRTSQGPARSLLKVTPAGRSAAQAWLSTPVEHPRDVRSELMVKLALLDRTGSDSRALVRAQLARLRPVAAALDDRLRATTGFEHTLALWRHAAMTATLRFLRDLAADRACLREELLEMSPISRGFRRRHTVPDGAADRVPPGQYVTDGFPVLSAGPTPHTPLAEWTFSVRRGSATLKSWTWQEFQELPAETVTVDIHCVTRWSKLDTEWRGVSVDTLLDQVEHDAGYVMAFSDGGYTTNLPLEDVTGGKARVAFSYAGTPLEPEHGGPARLLVPHLYFWKSAKWVRGLELMDEDRPGFWETYGYNMYGDPWKEQRYQGD